MKTYGLNPDSITRQLIYMVSSGKMSVAPDSNINDIKVMELSGIFLSLKDYSHIIVSASNQVNIVRS